jgi:acyl carrier protein phosphodiesterase
LGGFGDFIKINKIVKFDSKIPQRTLSVKDRKNMARQTQNKFIKRQKELDRMRKAKDKMAKRQSKKDKSTEIDGSDILINSREDTNHQG